MNSGASDSSKKSCANLSLPFCFLLMFFSTLYVMNGSQPYLQLQACALQYGVATSILIWSLYRFSCFDLDINNSEIFSELDRTLREKDEWIKFGDIIELHSPIMKNIE